MKCDFVEEAVVNAMREWLSEYTIKVDTEQPPQADPTETALNLIQQQLLELQSQQDKICEYLEKGVYTVEMFSKRNDTLTREMQKLQKAEADLQKKQATKNGEKEAVKELIQRHSVFLIAIRICLLQRKIVFGRSCWRRLRRTAHQRVNLACTSILNCPDKEKQCLD